MAEIRELTQLEAAEFPRLIVGYVSHAKYAVRREQSPAGWTFALERVPLATPYRKRYDHLSAANIADYQRILALGFSLGAYEAGECVGLAIAEVSPWNQTYWVHELHTAPAGQRRGIGRQLVGALAAKGRASGLRMLLCETQNTNVPAIDFYQAMGFTLEGLDLSHYRNTDYPDGEMVVYMKKRLAP
jgi:ribosomal protein S18 acetylase RimI-like enzyme